MPLDDEPRALAVDLLSQIINYIKQSTPVRTDGKATSGFVYSVLRVGQMISPRDFALPYSPIGGSPAPASAGAPPPPGDVQATVAAAQAKAAAQANTQRAMQAGFNVEQLVDTMLVVTNDGTYETYGGGSRHLAFEYHEILQAMSAPPPPEQSADVKARLEAANKVLYDGTAYTPLYQTYIDNQNAFTTAQSDYATKSLQLLANPATADLAPMLLQPQEAKVEQARDKWKTQGADEVEAALDTIQSQGKPLEEGAIRDANDLFDSWNLPLLGVAAKVPYSYILPTDWAAFDTDNTGWTQLTITQDDYSSHFDNHGFDLNVGAWNGESESSSGSVGVSVCGFGFNGSYSEADASSSAESSAQSSDGSRFSNDAKNLTIDLEYGLCEIVRPWLVTDLFHLSNWYLVGKKANCISKGTVDDQVGNEDLLMPMIPTHFLVIRNVSISAEEWGTDSQTLSSYYERHDNSASSHSSTVGGGVEVPVFGPICLDAGASHSETGVGGDYHNEAGSSFSNDYKAHFDGSTLTVHGAQAVAWLSEIVPACPPMDDPGLAHQ
jgi:hypothetical protein